MTTEKQRPPVPLPQYSSIHYVESEMEDYGSDCFEAGRQQGMEDEQLLRALALDGQELEAGRPQWISVEERLPEKFVEVLVWFKEGFIPATGQYTDSKHDHGGWCYPTENIEDRDNPPTVTHWMALPPSPKD